MITFLHDLFLFSEKVVRNIRKVRVIDRLFVKASRFLPDFNEFVAAFDLLRLYGLLKTLQLYKYDFYSRWHNTLINKRIKAHIEQMARDQYVWGSAARPGWLYHDYALPERDSTAHRKNTAKRLLLLKKNLPIYKSRILDIGCSSGGISLGLASLGALKVTGLDHDNNAIAIAQAVSEKYAIDNVEFHASSLQDFEIPAVDIVIWLSQWMWVVKQGGLEFGKDLLFDVPRKAKAEIMIFESAAGSDGKAGIPGVTQKDIENFLLLCTPFTSVKSIGPFQDAWRLSGKERLVFVCSEPKLEWKRAQAITTRIDRHTILKKYREEYIWAKDIEKLCLHRLEAFPYFPKLIDSGKDWIKIEWVGHRVTKRSQLDQLPEIISILAQNNIVHRDINPTNLLFKDGQLCLVDFGWAIVDGTEPPVKPPEGLGQGNYTYGEWDDAKAAKKVLVTFPI